MHGKRSLKHHGLAKEIMQQKVYEIAIDKVDIIKPD